MLMFNKELFNYLQKIIIKELLHLFWIFPVNKKKITLLNELSYTYGDSLKYLDQYLHKNYGTRYTVIYPIKNKEVLPKNGDIPVTPMTFKYFKELLTSGIIITNAGGVSYLPKRKGQKIISTWHGGGPYKKTSTDVYKNYWYQKQVDMNSENTDFMLSSCRYFTDYEARSMGYPKEKCIASGLPRNDIIFADHTEISQKVRKHYGISEDTKFILYAPTFRSESKNSTGEMIASHIDVDINLLLDTLREKTGHKWICGIRLHPKIKNVDMGDMNVIECTSYPDMQELLCCADAIITDYSSLMWDYSFTYKPCFLYAPDIEQYEEERGFYMPVAEWPYPLAHNNEELMANILSYDAEVYKEKVKQHHLASGSYEQGNACAIVMRLIESDERLEKT